jgi:hypothetical protein
MKRMLLFVSAIALVLAAAPVASASRGIPAGSHDIVFDGYCDGLHFNVPSAGTGDATTTDGDQTGCDAGGVFGQFSKAKKALYFTVPGYETFTVINLNHTWTHYGFNGNQITLVNSGTWSFGTPNGRAAKPSNTQRAAAASAVRPNAVYDISFDGYCDGMQFNVPSVGLGTAGTVDGNRTGCSSEGLIGATTKISGQSQVAVTFNTGGTWIQTAVFIPSHTWIHYSVSGDLIFVLNSGTWSPGPPAGSGHSSTG